MSALPSDQLAPVLGAAHLPAHPGAIDTSAARRSIWAQQLALLTIFWVYVAVSNILYANAMRESMAGIPGGPQFAPWDARLLQHVLLYPVLVGCVWLSLRLGWRPLWRTAPIQVLCAVVFSALAAPVLWVCEKLFGSPMLKR